MPEFYKILARKIIKIPEFLWYLPEKFTKFPNFTWFLPENARILRNNCPKNIFSRILLRHVPSPCPPSPMPMPFRDLYLLPWKHFLAMPLFDAIGVGSLTVWDEFRRWKRLRMWIELQVECSCDDYVRWQNLRIHCPRSMPMRSPQYSDIQS